MKKLELINVKKTFYTELGALDVVDDISFDVNEGEIVAIVGPSGSGKSTLLNIISKLLSPTSGEIIVDGDIICFSTIIYLIGEQFGKIF